MPAASEEEHLSIVNWGHADSGKNPATGRLTFELGGLPEHELAKLAAEAGRLRQGSLAFAFYVDRQKEGRKRGATIARATKELHTEKWRYMSIVAPGHRDFIKNRVNDASRAGFALIMVAAGGNCTTAIAKGNHKAGDIQGLTRQRSRLINLLSVWQVRIGASKMACDVAGYKQSRYDMIASEMESMLVKIGWKTEFIEKTTPMLPNSDWMGDNLLTKPDHMAWWKGRDVVVGKETIHRDTFSDVLHKLCRVPERPISAPMSMPISRNYKIKGVGAVLAGRAEQGVVQPDVVVVFPSTHTASHPCTDKGFTVEVHHQRVDFTSPGGNVGLNIKGLGGNMDEAVTMGVGLRERGWRRREGRDDRASRPRLGH